MNWFCSKYLYKQFIDSSILLRAREKCLIRAQHFSHGRPTTILGIESSCDDTGCGIVDSNGTVLGEAINSQYLTHLNFGGIIPVLARSLHVKNITKTCEDALKAANLKLQDIDAIAATVKPGLLLSLKVGVKFGKYLAEIGGKPFIPIHHMEAHALTARMTNKIDFPYLVLLVSGGHCLLAIVQDVNKFYLLGTSTNNSPGEIFDKIARRLKLKNIPEFSMLNGGTALETAARKAMDIDKFSFPPFMTKYRDCNFSFSGLFSLCNFYIQMEEEKYNVTGDTVIPNAYDLCAAFQLAMFEHICQRTQRAMEFIDRVSPLPHVKKTLVVSGGVACNNVLLQALSILCTELGYELIRTPPKLCTDNGVMIAWNGMEKWNSNIDIIRDQKEIEKVKVESRAPLGEDWTKMVKNACLKCQWVKIKSKLV